MMHRRHFAVWAGAACMGSASAGPGPTAAPAAAALSSAPRPAGLRLITEEFPPVSFVEGGVPRGLAVDLVHAIQQRLGQSLPIEVMPWARGMREAQDSQPTALFATARTPDRERLFHWVGPIIQFHSAFYAPTGRGPRPQSLAEARRVSEVLVVRDWYTAEQLQEAGFANLQLVNDPVQGLRMLLARRAPLFAGDRISMPGTLAQIGLPPDAVEEVFRIRATEGYIAFSRSTSPATVAAWQAQLNDMKRDGSFQAIYRRWLPNDTPPR